MPTRRSQIAFIRGAWTALRKDRSASCVEDGAEGVSEVRASVADQESDVLEPLVEAEDEVAGLLHGPLGGARGDAADAHGR